MSLRERLAKARARYRDAKQKKADTRPHSDRRKKLARLVRFWRDRVDRLKARLDRRRHHHRLDLNLSLGAPHWGGCEDIIKWKVEPLFAKAGVPVTSGKRPYVPSGSSTNSDHYTGVLNASARDGGTVDNYALRNAVCRALGVEAVIYDYGLYTFYVNGVAFRVQPIAGTHGTGPHLHIGIRRA